MFRRPKEHYPPSIYPPHFRQSQGLGDQTAFAEKVPLAKQGDYRFPPLLGGHDDFDLAAQNVEDRVGGVSLRENDAFALILKFGSAAARGRENHQKRARQQRIARRER